MARKTKKKQKPQRQQNALSYEYSGGGGRPLDFFTQFVNYPIEHGRDLNAMYNTPPQIFSSYYKMGKENGIGKAVINLPVNKCWQSFPEILDAVKFDDTGKPEEIVKSSFKLAWERLVNDRKLHLWERIKGLDRKQRFGMYAGAFIVARDNMARSAREPLDRLTEGQLVDIKLFYEAQLIPIEYEQDLSSPDYGAVKMYQLVENGVNPKPGKNLSLEIHPSRLIIAAEGAEDGTIYGTPSLEGCLAALNDWSKTRLASAEGLKRTNDQRAVMSLEEGSSLPHPDSPEAEMMDDNIRRWDDGQDSTLTVSNAKITPFSAPFHDPTKVGEMILMEVGASQGIPSTVLVGYQTGRLASEEDSFTFAQNMQQRRINWCEELLMQFVDKFIMLGLLPEPDGDVYIKWDDLAEPSVRDKILLGKEMAETDEKLFRTGRNPFYGYADYSEVTGFVGAQDDEDVGAEEEF